MDDRADEQCRFKRLDRIVVNQELLGGIGCAEMEQLARTRLDDAFLLLLCGDHNQQFHKPFRFLKF